MDQDLMQRIKTQWGEKIIQACGDSGIPPAFIAALIANETGGKADASNLEKNIYDLFQRVRSGARPHWGAVTQRFLMDYDDEGVANLATSRGLTQICGYNAVFHKVSPLMLSEPDVSLALTVKMFLEFARGFKLDVTKDFEAMLRCWNGGNPKANTAVPEYVPHGLARMEIYRTLV